jgi:hypothetical protein
VIIRLRRNSALQRCIASILMFPNHLRLTAGWARFEPVKM